MRLLITERRWSTESFEPSPNSINFDGSEPTGPEFAPVVVPQLALATGTGAIEIVLQIPVHFCGNNHAG